jgi:hypothetical protein
LTLTPSIRCVAENSCVTGGEDATNLAVGDGGEVGCIFAEGAKTGVGDFVAIGVRVGLAIGDLDPVATGLCVATGVCGKRGTAMVVATFP